MIDNKASKVKVTPSNSEVSMSSWSFIDRRSVSRIPEGASASSIRWVWSGSTAGAGLASSSAYKEIETFAVVNLIRG